MLERQLADLLEGTTDAGFIVDLQGEVKTWNKAAEKLFGYPASFAIGKTCASLIGNEIASRSAVCRESCDLLECVRQGRDVANFDMEVRTRSGGPVWVNVSLIVASDNRTERCLAIHLMRDIGEKKRAERLTEKVLRSVSNLVNIVRESDTNPPMSPVTAQEKNILTLLAAGKTSKEIAAELQISQRTLRNHVYHINQKLHTSSRVEAVAQALKRRLI